MLAIIGGSGLSRIPEKSPRRSEHVATPYAETPVRVDFFAFGERELAFLPRHGDAGAVPPHRINYRANLWALHKLGFSSVVGINVVGGIHPDMMPGALMVPDQLIDYTHGRIGTYFEDDLEQVTHIDFTYPFDEGLRRELLDRLEAVNRGQATRRHVAPTGVYGCTQGPRLETAAEITRMARDGCDIVGMTAMPEAALARELGLAYALLALSVNRAAGLSSGEISMAAIGREIDSGMGFVLAVLEDWPA